MSEFRVGWLNTCYMCDAPLEILVSLKPQTSNKFLKTFYTYMMFNRFRLENNVSYLKILNLKQRYVCRHCFRVCKRKRMNLRDVMQREVSGKPIKSPFQYLRPKTPKEIFTWFESFNNFQHRQDIDDYLITFERIYIPNILFTVI